MANKRYTVYQKLTVKLISDLLRFIKPSVQPGGFFWFINIIGLITRVFLMIPLLVSAKAIASLALTKRMFSRSEERAHSA